MSSSPPSRGLLLLVVRRVLPAGGYAACLLLGGEPCRRAVGCVRLLLRLLLLVVGIPLTPRRRSSSRCSARVPVVPCTCGRPDWTEA